METVKQALALEEAGCFAIVLECVPASIGAAVQNILSIPVIGIGAGPACAGQVSTPPLLNSPSLLLGACVS